MWQKGTTMNNGSQFNVMELMNKLSDEIKYNPYDISDDPGLVHEMPDYTPLLWKHCMKHAALQ